MSLLFDADGDQVSLAAVTPAGGITAAVWFYPTDDTVRQSLWHHLSNDTQIVFDGSVANDPIQCWRAGATYGEAYADAASFARFGLNKWCCLVFRAGVGASPSVFVGDATNPPEAPSAYTFQTTLVTPSAASGQILIGANLTSTRWIRGRLGAYAWWDNVVLSDAEVAKWWANPYGFRSSEGGQFPTPAAFGRPGSNGTTDVPDESGNGRTGTITGLSSPDTEPFVVFTPTWVKAMDTGHDAGCDLGVAA